MKQTEEQTVNQSGEQTIVFKKLSFKEYLKSIGPGIVFALTALGAGDLVENSVSGSHYGYALMWVLALALLVRFVVTNIMARFELCNTQHLTLFQAYAKITRFFPYLFVAFSVFLGHVINSSMSKGIGQTLAIIVGAGNPLLWSVVAVASCFLIGGRNVYKKLEIVMKVLLAIMTVSFFSLAIASRPDPVEMAKGLFTFAIPEGTGVFSAMLLAFSMFGTVAGSLLNFLYPHSIREKGWNNASYKKIQRNELLFSVVMLILLDLSIWIVGAEILRPAGIEVKSLEDLSKALEMAFGHIGSVIFYLGVFGTIYSSLLGIASCFSAVVIENIQVIKPERTEKYGIKAENDPIYKYFYIFFLVTPLVWSLPGMPEFVALTLVINLFNTLVLPAVFIGLLFLTMSNKYLDNRFKNNWFENIVLIGVTLLVVLGAIRLAAGFFA